MSELKLRPPVPNTFFRNLYRQKPREFAAVLSSITFRDIGWHRGDGPTNLGNKTKFSFARQFTRKPVALHDKIDGPLPDLETLDGGRWIRHFSAQIDNTPGR